MLLGEFYAAASPAPISVSLEHNNSSNNRSICSQSLGLSKLCACGDVLSQDKLSFRGVCVDCRIAIHSPDPFQGIASLLPHSVYSVVAHWESRDFTGQFNSVSRSFNLRRRLILPDITTNTCETKNISTFSWRCDIYIDFKFNHDTSFSHHVMLYLLCMDITMTTKIQTVISSV
jgi:hypothetical protein